MILFRSFFKDAPLSKSCFEATVLTNNPPKQINKILEDWMSLDYSETHIDKKRTCQLHSLLSGK